MFHVSSIQGYDGWGRKSVCGLLPASWRNNSQAEERQRWGDGLYAWGLVCEHMLRKSSLCYFVLLVQQEVITVLFFLSVLQVWLQDSQGVQLERQEQSQQGLWRELLLYLQRWRWCLLQWAGDPVSRWSEKRLVCWYTSTWWNADMQLVFIRSNTNVDVLEFVIDLLKKAQNKQSHD